MVDGDEVVPSTGRPIDPASLDDEFLGHIEKPEDAPILSIEQARAALPLVIRILPVLQSLHDEARSLTEELEYLLDGMDPEDDHVVEVSDMLARTVMEWQTQVAAIQETGAMLKAIDPGLIDWYGIVDDTLVLFCWKEGEDDIEWYHHPADGFSGRRPLVEA